MCYLKRIQELKKKLEEMKSPARLDLPFVESRPPTQAFSEFLTNKEQGDWAERTFIENFNRVQENHWAVKYGRSEDLVAGEPGFDDYYRAYQAELREIGKRPDVLVFERAAFAPSFGTCTDCSNFDRETLDRWVPRAVSAIEVRSSAFLSRRYDAAVAQARSQLGEQLRQWASQLLKDYPDEIARGQDWKPYLEKLLRDGMDPNIAAPRALGLHSTERLSQASALTKAIKGGLRSLSQRDFLSLTPKAEDLTLVYRWIQRYGVPHHYCQVFFDRAVMLSFEEILGILATPKREGRDFFIEADEKNQGKVTFKINVQLGREVLNQVDLPEHASAMKELPQGRLLFYVKFKPSQAVVVPGAIRHD
ncbi:MAG: AccI family restriction endonuclease [Pseudomonadota bacterium]